jgi:hypothetical protein
MRLTLPDTFPVVRDTLPEQDEKSRFAISETMYEKSALSVYKVVT